MQQQKQHPDEVAKAKSAAPALVFPLTLTVSSPR
jgi:hypothetical protein